MDCQFLEPVELDTGEWEYSKMSCTTTGEHFEQVINADFPSRNFYIDKSFSYGDAIIIWFLTIAMIFVITKTIFNFFWKK